MSDSQPQMSNAFQTFLTQAPHQAEVWMSMVKTVNDASALDAKTEELVHLGIAAALRLESGVPFHVQLAKKAGATREEVISAILVGLPLAGQVVAQVLPAALATYDSTA